MHLDFHQHFRSGRVNLQSLISRVFALRQAGEALACAKTGVVKVQLDLN